MRFLIDLYRRWTTPTTVTADQVERLQTFIFAPVSELNSYTPESLSASLKTLSESAELYNEWIPRLRALATRTGSQSHSPSPDSLSQRDLAKLAILESMIAKSEPPPRRFRHHAVMVVTSFLGMSIASRYWPGSDDRCLLLTREQLEHWNSIYDHPDQVLHWYSFFHFNIEDPPSQCWFDQYDLSVPSKTEPWIVYTDRWIDHWQMGGEIDLWSWDGTQATFVRSIDSWDS